MFAFVDAGTLAVYLQRATTALTNSSTVPKRRRAAFQGWYPSVLGRAAIA